MSERHDPIGVNLDTEIPVPNLNSDIKPPLLVVDPQRLYRPGEKTVKLWKIRNSNTRLPKSFTAGRSNDRNSQVYCIRLNDSYGYLEYWSMKFVFAHLE